jgi:hypothetical protein
MEKVMFSAIAMMAFVGSSMANTSEVKVVEKKIATTVSLCSDIYQATYVEARNQGANNDQAAATAWRAYSTCVDKTISQDLQP